MSASPAKSDLEDGHSPVREGGVVPWPDVEVADADLVVRSLEGEQWARAALYRRYAEEVAGLALRLLRDREEMRDVVQDTFVTALSKLSSLEAPSRVGAWLRTIAVRHAHRRLRRRRLLSLLGFRSTEIPLEELAKQDAGQEARLELARIDSVLRELPIRARTVWTMRVIDKETLPEIAEAVGCSLATVKRDVRLAEDRIRTMFEEQTAFEGEAR